MAHVTRAVTALMVVASTLAAAAAEAAVPGDELLLTFDGPAPLASSGAAPLEVTVVTANGGTATIETTEERGGVLRLPAYLGTRPPMAALRVVDATDGDHLSPGTADFVFGADFTLDAVSQGRLPDNGNNLIQRGLFNSPMQYKIQIDGRRPLCRVKGSTGAVVVRSPVLVTTDTWHRATCSRTGPTVTLQVTRLADGATWTSLASGETGSLGAESAVLPLSVGAKLNSSGQIVSKNSDQFNGQVDMAFLDISTDDAPDPS